ncbi:MAG: LysR family transcriptional regulator [Gammaproteobacteria bacterium]
MSRTSSDWFIRSRLKLRQLRLLDVLDESRNLRRAAEMLDTSQPAATKLLQEIEAMLGVVLFERRPRGMVTTGYGEIMVRHARTVLDELGRAREELAAVQAGATGKVIVGCVPSVVADVLAQALTGLHRGHPGLLVSVRVETSDVVLSLLRKREIDLAIARVAEDEPDGLSCTPLGEDMGSSFVVRFDHPLTRKPDLCLQDLLGWPWVLQPPGSPLRRSLDPLLRRLGVPVPAQRIETASTLTIASLLSSTDMLSVMPVELARHYEARGQLRALPIGIDCNSGSYGIVMREDYRASAACTALIEAIRSAHARTRPACARPGQMPMPEPLPTPVSVPAPTAHRE